MADGGGLENRCSRKGTVGSNPTPSANNIFSHPAAPYHPRLSPLVCPTSPHGVLKRDYYGAETVTGDRLGNDF